MNELRRNAAPQAVARARDFRKNMGRAEKRLWYDGLARKRLGFYFRRQYPLGPYFLDFYCTEVRVCVEVDGIQHEFSCEHDARRDRWLAENGILTLRYAADSVMLDLPHILWKIEEACKSRTEDVETGGVNDVLKETGTSAPTLPSPTGVGEAPDSELSTSVKASLSTPSFDNGASPTPVGEGRVGAP